MAAKPYNTATIIALYFIDTLHSTTFYNYMMIRFRDLDTEKLCRYLKLYVGSSSYVVPTLYIMHTYITVIFKKLLE